MTDNNRLIDLAVASSPDTWLATELMGEDYLSAPFYFSVRAFTNNLKLNSTTLLQQTVSLRIGKEDGEQHLYNGLVTKIIRDNLPVDGWQAYQLIVQPWLSNLTSIIDSRVFAVSAPRTIPQLVTDVFKQYGYHDFTLDLHKTYTPLTVSVQYKESAFNFVSRLLQQAGIYYYFTHTKDKHTMVLSDGNFPQVNAKAFDAQHSSDSTSTASVSHWEHTVSTVPQSINLQQWNAAKNSVATASATTVPKSTMGLPPMFKAALYQHASSDALSLSTEAQFQAQAYRLRADSVEAQSTYPSWQAGTHFSLAKHPHSAQTGDYYIYAIAHLGHDNTQLSSALKGNQSEDAPSQHYHNVFRAYRTSKVFVPQGRYVATDFPADEQLLPPNDNTSLLHPLNAPIAQVPITTPHINGVQTAMIVGPKGTALYNDKYGRVRVQFKWDSNASNDENSFCWVRLGQPFAGSGFGVHATPRIGQEVLISFEQGDPNRPLVIGTLANDSNKPAFTPDKTPSIVGWKSKSLDPAAAQFAQSGHALQFNDDPTVAGVSLHSQRDLSINAGGNYTANVGGNATVTVNQGDHVQLVNGKLTITAGQAVHLVSGQSRVSVTSSDIIIEADKIVLGKG